MTDAQRQTAAGAPAVAHRAAAEWIVLAILTGGVTLMGTLVAMPAPLLVPISAAFGRPVGQVAQLAAITALPWAFSGPLAGPLSDRFGRKPLLIVGFGTAAVTTLAGALATSFEMLFALRFLTGVGSGATGPIIMAYVGDYFTPERRSRAYGVVLSGFPIAALVGVPSIALVVGLYGWQWGFGLVGAAMVLVVLATVVALPHLGRQGGASLNIIAPLLPLLRRPAVVLLLLANMGERGGTMVAQTFLPAYLIQSYGLRVEATAGPLVAVALGALLGSWLGGRLADRFSKPGVFGVTELAGGVFAVPLFLLAPALVVTTALATLVSLLGTAGRPAMLWLVSQVAPQSRGAMLGLYSMSNQLAFTIGTTAAGLLLVGGDFDVLAGLCLAFGLMAGLPCVLLARDPTIAGGPSTAPTRPRIDDG
jgi:predicted MFS family arabinose efflux permease